MCPCNLDSMPFEYTLFQTLRGKGHLIIRQCKYIHNSIQFFGIKNNYLHNRWDYLFILLACLPCLFEAVSNFCEVACGSLKTCFLIYSSQAPYLTFFPFKNISFPLMHLTYIISSGKESRIADTGKWCLLWDTAMNIWKHEIHPCLPIIGNYLNCTCLPD